VNWKNVADNFSDGLHINVAHPGLTRLFGKGYGIEARPWIDKMWGTLRDTPSANWSERLYQHFLPKVEHLPPERQRLWTYFKFWPNVAFDIYPDQVDFMQFIPVSATETLIREIAYVHPDVSREMRAARYLTGASTAVASRTRRSSSGSERLQQLLLRPFDGEVCLCSFAPMARYPRVRCRTRRREVGVAEGGDGAACADRRRRSRSAVCAAYLAAGGLKVTGERRGSSGCGGHREFIGFRNSVASTICC
jgi:hypothetical protein